MPVLDNTVQAVLGQPMSIGAFHQAVEQLSPKRLRKVLSRVVPLNDQDDAGVTALMRAVRSGNVDKIRLLLACGADPELTDHLDRTALDWAVSRDFIPGIELLLNYGVDRGYHPKYPRRPMDADLPVFEPGPEAWGEEMLPQTIGRALLDISIRKLAAQEDPFRPIPAIGMVRSLAALQLFLDEGDPLTDAPLFARCKYLGLEANGEIHCSRDEYLESGARVFGKTNGEVIKNPFYTDMVHSAASATTARFHFESWLEDCLPEGTPIWSNDRVGISLTRLANGNWVQIGGQYDDAPEYDYCVYNDVIEYDGRGEFTIYGYPKDVFPPTDHHSATLINDHLYVIGGLGDFIDDDLQQTNVYRWNIQSKQFEQVVTQGQSPQQLFKHTASYDPHRQAIIISGGKRHTDVSKPAECNEELFVLDLRNNTSSEVKV